MTRDQAPTLTVTSHHQHLVISSYSSKHCHHHDQGEKDCEIVWNCETEADREGGRGGRRRGGRWCRGLGLARPHMLTIGQSNHLLTLSDIIWHCVTLCDTVWHCVTISDTVGQYLTQCETIWHYVTLSDTLLWHSVTLCDTIWHFVTHVWHYLTLCDTLWHHLTPDINFFWQKMIS